MQSELKEEQSVYTLNTGRQGEHRLNILNQIYNDSSRALLKRHNVQNFKRVLDVGCGTGEMACWIASEIGNNGMVIGIDQSDGQIEVATDRAAKMGLKNIKFIQLSAYELEKLKQMGHDDFNMVYCRFVLAHVQFPQKILAGMKNVLAEQGTFICEEAKTSDCICEPHSDAFDTWTDIWTKLRIAKGADPDFGVKLAALLKNIGLDDIESHAVRNHLPVGELRTIFVLNIQETWNHVLEAKLATAKQLEELEAALHKLITDENVTMSFSSSVQVTAKNDLCLTNTMGFKK